MRYVVIGDQDSQALEDAHVSGPYSSRDEADAVCEMLCGDANHGTYYVTELLPPLMDEPMTPEEVIDVTKRGDFDWVFENAMHPLPDCDHNHPARLCPWCGRTRVTARQMADHVSSHHRDEMTMAELETLERYLEAHP